MARKIILKDNGLNGEGNAPSGYSYLGKDGTTLSEKVGATVSAIGGGSEYTETILNVTSSQILNMGTTPIEILPAPGANKYYDIDRIVLEYTHNGTPYTLPDPAKPVLEINGSSSYIFIPIVFQSTSSGIYIIKDFKIVIGQSPNDSQDLTLQRHTLNSSCLLTMGGGAGNPSLGNGELRIKIYHKTVTFGS